jgi:TolB-like protein
VRIFPVHRIYVINLRALRERKIAQWLLAYLAGAWALVQVADVVGGHFNWPASLIRILIVLLAVGALATLVLAWYHGERGIQRVTRVELGLLGLLLVSGGLAVIWVRGTDGSAPGEKQAGVIALPALGSAAEKEASIAVLPFVNLSGVKDNEYFSDGITEEILAALGRNRQLRVISRTSVEQYKGTNKPIKQIAAELGVRAVLEGSVRREGGKVRVTAQLIDAQNDIHLWAENYDGDLVDIFAIQRDIAERIARALQVALSRNERDALSAGRTEDLAAYDLYLKALAAHYQAAEVDEMHRAVALYHAAIAADTAYALAYVGLANAQMDIYDRHLGAPWRDSAYATIHHALRIAPGLAEAYAILGYIESDDPARHEAALAANYRALAIDPNNSIALRGMAFHLWPRGELEEALRWALRATLVDPADHIAQALTARIYGAAGDVDAAERWYVRSLETEDGAWARSGLLQLYINIGAFDRAERVMQTLRADKAFPAAAPAFWQSELDFEQQRYPEAFQLMKKADALARREPGQHYVPSADLAYLYWRRGDRRDAERLLREIEASFEKDRAEGRNPDDRALAQIEAIRGNRNAALGHLKAAAAKNWYSTAAIRNSPVFESLRTDPEFQKILADVDAQGAALRSRMARIAS